MFEPVGRALAQYLTKPVGKAGGSQVDARLVAQTLAPGDVLLVEGNTRMSAAIKYLTQSTWSHAALYVGERPELGASAAMLVEADVVDGVRAVPHGFYDRFRVRICRPVNLTEEDRERLLRYVIERIGHRYDLKNVFDLLRYLIPIPLPARLRRRMMAFGSGDPTRAICSTLVAQAFAAVRYPILPVISSTGAGAHDTGLARELWRIRHYSLYVPRDFDVSPFFEVVKPRIAANFDYREAPWSKGGTVVFGDAAPTERCAPPSQQQA